MNRWMDWLGVHTAAESIDYGKLGHYLLVRDSAVPGFLDLTQVGVGVSQVIDDSTCERPTSSYQHSGGREGRHTEHFGYLLAELQHIARAHPGASW